MEKDLALQALVHWAHNNSLRDPLIVQAYTATPPASIAEIMRASGLAKNTVRTAIAATDSASLTPTASDTSEMRDHPVSSVSAPGAVDPLVGYHHEHFISGRYLGEKYDKDKGQWQFEFRPFIGHETEPQAPVAAYRIESNLTPEQMRTLTAEYTLATELWAEARFRRQLQPRLSSAAETWNAYRQCRTAMDTAYTTLLNAPDGQWKAKIAVLLDTHEPALRAARNWDEVARSLITPQHEYEVAVGEYRAHLQVKHIAAENGVDAGQWEFDSFYSYEEGGDHWVTSQVTSAIAEQKAKLRQIADLSSSPTS